MPKYCTISPNVLNEQVGHQLFLSCCNARAGSPCDTLISVDHTKIYSCCISARWENMICYQQELPKNFITCRDNQCVGTLYLSESHQPKHCTTPQNVNACTCLPAHPPQLRHRGETLALPSGVNLSSGSSTTLTPTQDGWRLLWDGLLWGSFWYWS